MGPVTAFNGALCNVYFRKDGITLTLRDVIHREREQFLE